MSAFVIVTSHFTQTKQCEFQIPFILIVVALAQLAVQLRSKRMLSDYSGTTVPYLRLSLLNMCLSRAAVQWAAPKTLRMNIKHSEGTLFLNSRKIWMYAVQPC